MKSRETKQRKTLTLGSLFDGSGGFPLAGILAGIKPIWASEIEPFAIRVTTKRLPDVKHYGDVSTINGADLEPVDIITFGSPCQDLSIAGKRSGLDGSWFPKPSFSRYSRAIFCNSISVSTSSGCGLREICTTGFQC